MKVLNRRSVLAGGAAAAVTLASPSPAAAATRLRSVNARRKPPDPVAEAYAGPINVGDLLEVRNAVERGRTALYWLRDVEGLGLRLVFMGAM